MSLFPVEYCSLLKPPHHLQDCTQNLPNIESTWKVLFAKQPASDHIAAGIAGLLILHRQHQQTLLTRHVPSSVTA